MMEDGVTVETTKQIIATDERFRGILNAYNYQRASLETLMMIVIHTWYSDRINREAIDQAQQIIDDSEWRF